MKSINLKVFSIILTILISTGLVVKANINQVTLIKTEIPNNIDVNELISHGDLIAAFIAIISISIFVLTKK